MSTKYKRLGVQQLEEKTLMAGDVALIEQGGVLQFLEADVNQNQQVQVSRWNNGFIRVQGLGNTDIHHNGQVRDVVYLPNSSFSNGIFAQLGGGNDSLIMSGGLNTRDVNINTGAGVDNVTVAGVDAVGDVIINTGSQNDSVTVSNTNVFGSGNDLRINTGSGRDFVTIDNVHSDDDVVVQTYSSSTSNENDEVTVKRSDFDDFYGYFGAGNDEVLMDDNDFDNAHLHLGNGHDQAEFKKNVADEIHTRGGSGNDDVRAEYNTVGYFNFAGDSGYDEYFEKVGSWGKDTNSFGTLKLSSAIHRRV